ncbi:Isoaspartyl dipeptidase [Fusobacterium necrophorum subsp. necrophorum]|nr:Isoaspartyl dipeptidase [Fusobacterium necrophorum subsp. necrophorum]
MWKFGVDILNGSGKKLVPGFIDQHVHLIGGGGEGAFIHESGNSLSKLIEAGITTVVGVLGTDSTTRNIKNYWQGKGIKNEGISAYMTTGAYSILLPH